jgi:hypothetical protein
MGEIAWSNSTLPRPTVLVQSPSCPNNWVVAFNTEHSVRVPKGPRSERRDSIRFALTLEVKYTVSGVRGSEKAGTGRTVDLSSSGLNFITDRPLLNGQELTVSIDWPVLLGGATKLQLFLSGVVVRTNGTTAALRIERHEFRTRRLALKAVPPKESNR